MRALVDAAMILPGGLNEEDLFLGRSAVRGLSDPFPVAVGAPVLEEPCAQEFDETFPRALWLALTAVGRLRIKPGRKFGLVLALPNMFSETAYVDPVCADPESTELLATRRLFWGSGALHFLAERLGIEGPKVRVDSACAGGSDALITACRWLDTGLVDDCLVVAAASMLNPVGCALFKNLKALSESDQLWASCPFDRRRSGFVMGEGAAAAILTRNPKTESLGYVLGFGNSMSAEKFTDLPEDLGAPESACRQALGSRTPAFVCAHGTATRRGDLVETRLHKQLFAGQAANIPLVSIKSMIGHTIAAAALIEAVICLSALRRGMAPPTINLQEPDPLCDLNYGAVGAQPISGNICLSNAFAFGGHNSSLCLGLEPHL